MTKLIGMRYVKLFVLAVTLAGCNGLNGDPALPQSNVEPWAPGVAYSTAELPAVRGMRDYRGIVHLHSYMSHDACDGHKDASFSDADCKTHLRDAICATKQDYILLTDHPAFFEDHEFPETLLYDGGAGDELIAHDGGPAANRMQCPNGHQVLLQAGYEASKLMPVGFYRHAGTSPAERSQNYGTDTTAGAQLLIDHGADIYIPHTESKDFAWFSQLPISAIEIYNIHANLDPEIRRDHLGLDELGYMPTLFKFTDLAETAPHPDLLLLAFFTANENDLEKWDRLLLQKKVAGIAGTDAHENVFTSKMRDGERGDSYRRIMSFFSNHVLTEDPLGLDTAKKAIASLRGYVAFEAFGVPLGFDFHAVSGTQVFEMGDDAPATADLVLRLPAVLGLPASAERPEVTGIIYRLTETGRVEVARGSDDITLKAPGEGVYRAEVHIVPHHARPYLGELAAELIHEFPWVYANPVFLVAP